MFNSQVFLYNSCHRIDHIRCNYSPRCVGNWTEYPKSLSNVPKFTRLGTEHRNPGCETRKCSGLLPWMSSTSSHHVAFVCLKLFGLRDTEEEQLEALRKKSCPGPKKARSRLMTLDATAFKLLVYNQAILKPDLQALQRRALWFSKADMFGILGGRSNPLWCSVYNKISSAEIRDTPVNF